MKVSKNELMASLKKAFEGLGFQPGDYHNAADMVVWLETHGFDGFDRSDRSDRSDCSDRGDRGNRSNHIGQENKTQSRKKRKKQNVPT